MLEIKCIQSLLFGRDDETFQITTRKDMIKPVAVFHLPRVMTPLHRFEAG